MGMGIRQGVRIIKAIALKIHLQNHGFSFKIKEYLDYFI